MFPIAGVFSRDHPVRLRHETQGIPAEDPVGRQVQVHQGRVQISGGYLIGVWQSPLIQGE